MRNANAPVYARLYVFLLSADRLFCSPGMLRPACFSIDLLTYVYAYLFIYGPFSPVYVSDTTAHHAFVFFFFRTPDVRGEKEQQQEEEGQETSGASDSSNIDGRTNQSEEHHHYLHHSASYQNLPHTPLPFVILSGARQTNPSKGAPR